MKQTFLLLFTILSTFNYAQLGVGTATLHGGITPLQNTRPDISMPSFSPDQKLIRVKGLANVEPDYYKAIFEVHESGKNSEAVIHSIDLRIQKALKEISESMKIESHIDLVAMMPKYSVEITKSWFKKDVYHKKADGFDIKKNIHIKFSEGNHLAKILQILAKQDIYHLIKVNSFSKKLQDIKNQLKAECINKLKIKKAEIESLKSTDFSTYNVFHRDAFQLHYPLDNYESFETKPQSQYKISSSEIQTPISKNRTSYFNEIIPSDFDFVLNEGSITPVIQIVYQLEMIYQKKPDEKKGKDIEKIYYIIQNGQLKKINL
ncbi:MAG: hypothetical protein N4A45_02310 [Flavobacteriales bacterium]|jgi:hypothetical protein|nr:hypothetical protein [Flavobacteriales bacterium]